MTSSKKPPSPRRWHEQRWLTDVVVRAENIDWDQPRSGQTIGPIGSEATLEVNWAKARIRKYDDIAPAFIAAAERRERMAEEATARGHLVSAAENHYAAAILYTPAVWAITDDDNWLRRLYARINANYAAWMTRAPHKVERIELPFGNGKLPAYWHLPPGYSGGRLPTVLASGGMDTLPHNGAIITLLTITGMTHRQCYKDIFAITLIKIAASFFVIGLYYLPY